MVELAIRIGLASALMALSGALGAPSFDLTWRLMALFSAYSFLVAQMERRGLRNAGVAGAVAVADAALIAVLLGSAGLLGSFGFVALLPAVWAFQRFQANALAIAPLVSGAVLLSANLASREGMTPAVLGQSLLSLALGLLMGSPRSVEAPVSVEPDPADLLSALPAAISPMPTDHLELREKFRQLKDHTQELERKTRRDRLVAQLFDVQPASPEGFPQLLAEKLAEITGAEGMSIYTPAILADAMVVRASAGTLPEAIRTAMIDTSQTLNDAQMRHKADKALRALRTEDEKQLAVSVLLKDRGKLIGMLVLSHRTVGRLDEALARAEEAAPYVAALIARADREMNQWRRLRETEVLYSISSLCVGSDSMDSAGQRVLRDLWEMLTLDHLSLIMIQGEEVRVVATKGASAQPTELLRLPRGAGLAGWIAEGAPEFAAVQTGDDARIDRNAALKSRVGSMALLPIRVGADLRGLLVASTHSPGGVDLNEVETLRLVALELGQAFARLEAGEWEAEGLVTPQEFQRLVGRSEWGHLVYLEPLRLDSLIHQFGRPAFEHGVRALARRLRPSLPPGSLLCRRSEGDFVAFLPEMIEEEARSWMNQASTLAAMTPISTPDGKVRIPLGLRGKLAPYGKQKNQFLPTSPAEPITNRRIA